MKKENVVSILFGSGADTDYNANLGSGASFSQALLQNSYKDKCKKVTGNSSKYSLIYRQSKKVYIQTILENEEKANEAGIEPEIIDICKEYPFKNSEEKQEEYKYKNEKLTVACEDWYELLKLENSPEDKSEEKIQNFFLKNAVFFSSLDEKFNSLRYNDGKWSANAKRVINAYYTVFFYMIENIYDGDVDDSVHDIKDLLNFLKCVKKSDEYSKNNDKKYYDILKKILDSSEENNCRYFVTTTNYTDYVSEIFGTTNTAYLHGKLKWFEDLKTLQVFDCDDDNEYDKLLEIAETQSKSKQTRLIPFIMIPSGVKPLICKKQINEFKKFSDNLDKSDYLVIVGYNLNSEDNHINSIISSWLRENEKHKVIYLNYIGDKSVDSDTKTESIERYGWLDGIKIVSPYKDDISKIENVAEQFIVININSENCHDIFKNALTQISQNNCEQEKELCLI